MTTEYVEPQVVDPDLEGDHDRFTHIVVESFAGVAVGNSVVEGMINGTPVVALCGKRWVPGRDPKRYPMCPRCKEIAEQRGWKVPSG